MTGTLLGHLTYFGAFFAQASCSVHKGSRTCLARRVRASGPSHGSGRSRLAGALPP